MEKENPRRLSRTHQKRGFHPDQELEVTQLFSTFSRGTSIFLDIPLYRTGDSAISSRRRPANCISTRAVTAPSYGWQRIFWPTVLPNEVLVPDICAENPPRPCPLH